MKRALRHFAVGVLLAALFASSGVAQVPSQLQDLVAVDGNPIALTNVRVIDGTGAPARANQTIVISDGIIRAVGATGSVQVPQGARTVDLAGHTVIPGLVGLHNHSYYTAAGGRSAQLSYSGPRLYLASGVTTIRTTGARAPYEELNMKREIDAGRAVGPTIFVTGPYLTGEEGSQTMTQLSGAEDARRVVRYWAEEGVSWFKAYTWISRAELGAAIEEAHRHGVKVTAHLCSVTYREAVALGIDNLEHGLFANTDYVDDKQPDRCPPGFRDDYHSLDMGSPEVQATYRDMIENNVPMTSTLVVYEISVPGRAPIDPRTWDLLAPEIAEAVRTESVRRRDASPESNMGIHPAMYQKALEFEKAFVDAGGLLAAGVDPTGYGAALPGLGDQRNFELLLEAGFTPEQVVQIMSANGAKVLGIYEEVGSIEPGKIADLAVIRGNPASDGNIRNVVMVFKHGVGWDSEKLYDSVRGVVGIQ
jgi:enamidase